MFYSVHNLTEGQYGDMFTAADVVAERIRALGHYAPMSLKHIVGSSAIEDVKGQPTAAEMCAELAEDHERASHRLHALIELAEERKDMVTGDLATERAAFHEKAAWMLRAFAG